MKTERSVPARGGGAHAMWQRYAAFLRVPPELSMAWHDTETSARAWLIINSSRGGAAGGGTRMRVGVSPREVVYLAKTMELKFAICGPAIGGAKIGIDFDPHDARKADVLERCYRALAPMLQQRYGTAGDLNIDEVLDVIPAFARVGLKHPQEGVVRGYLHADGAAFDDVVARLEHGAGAPVDDVAGVPFTVADMITGYGVAVAVRRLYERRGRTLDGVRVLLEGFGNVGAAAALYLARAGAHIVAISDALQSFVEPAGARADDVTQLIQQRADKLLPSSDARVQPDPARTRFWSVPADVFVCAAISESVTPDILNLLAARGVGTIACGANQPFRETKFGSTRVARNADRRFAVLADVVANCGRARAFSYLMQPAAQPEAAAVFRAVERTIADTLDETVDRAGQTGSGLLAATLGLSLDRIGAAG